MNKKNKMILPRQIRLEAATVCQLKCPSCPTAAGETRKSLGAGFLKFQDFKKIIDENPWLSNIELSNWGELFLNKELIDIIKYAYRKNVALRAYNGANLNNIREEVLEALARYHFRVITCSIDGATQETYSQYRVKGNLHQVLENIRIINHYKERYGSPYPVLRWQFIPFGHNEHEIEQARQMAKDLNMSFSVKLSWEDLYTQDFSPIKNKERIARESGVGAASRRDFREKFGEEYLTKNCCLELFRAPQINYDGRLLGCAINYWADYGDVLTDGLKESLSNEQVDYARDMVMGKKEGREGQPCLRCKIYQQMQRSGNWLKESDFPHEYKKTRQEIMVENFILRYRFTRMCKEAYKKGRSFVKEAFLRLQGRRPQQLHSRVSIIKESSAQTLAAGWKFYPMFSGPASLLNQLSCHASVLSSGKRPHPPHEHCEEEILIHLKGGLDLIFPDSNSPGGLKRQALKPGEFVYYPAQWAHTLENTGEDPAHYMMLKWYASEERQGKHLDFKTYKIVNKRDTKELAAGFRPELVFEGPTAYLRKLHCHTSTLTPGGGYDPHKDDYDVILVVLEGEVETLGKRVGPYGAIFYAAGEPHGIRNPGDVMAKYIVFEFHGYKFGIRKRLSRFINKVKDPQRWQRKIKKIMDK